MRPFAARRQNQPRWTKGALPTLCTSSLSKQAKSVLTQARELSAIFRQRPRDTTATDTACFEVADQLDCALRVACLKQLAARTAGFIRAISTSGTGIEISAEVAQRAMRRRCQCAYVDRSRVDKRSVEADETKSRARRRRRKRHGHC